MCTPRSFLTVSTLEPHHGLLANQWHSHATDGESVTRPRPAAAQGTRTVKRQRTGRRAEDRRDDGGIFTARRLLATGATSIVASAEGEEELLQELADFCRVLQERAEAKVCELRGARREHVSLCSSVVAEQVLPSSTFVAECCGTVVTVDQLQQQQPELSEDSRLHETLPACWPGEQEARDTVTAGGGGGGGGDTERTDSCPKVDAAGVSWSAMLAAAVREGVGLADSEAARIRSKPSPTGSNGREGKLKGDRIIEISGAQHSPRIATLLMRAAMKGEPPQRSYNPRPRTVAAVPGIHNKGSMNAYVEPGRFSPLAESLFSWTTPTTTAATPDLWCQTAGAESKYYDYTTGESRTDVIEYEHAMGKVMQGLDTTMSCHAQLATHTICLYSQYTLIAAPASLARQALLPPLDPPQFVST